MEKKAARPSRAVATESILVREDILFSFITVSCPRFNAQHLSVAWGGS